MKNKIYSFLIILTSLISFAKAEVIYIEKKIPIFSNIENIKISEDNGYKLFESNNLISSFYKEPFNINFKVKEITPDKYEIIDGFFKKENGESNFSIVIKKDKLNKSNNIIDLIINSENIIFNSRNTNFASFILKQFGIEESNVFLNEKINIIKNEDKIEFNNIFLEIENTLKFEFSGIYDLKENLILSGKVEYKISDKLQSILNEKYDNNIKKENSINIENKKIDIILKDLF